MGKRKKKQLVPRQLIAGTPVSALIYSSHTLDKSTCPQLQCKIKLQIAQRSSEGEIRVVPAT